MAHGFFSLRAQGDGAADRRTAVRQSAILDIRSDTGLPGDEDDWDIVYPLEHLRWLADIVETLGLQPSILDILNVESLYPALMTDISTVIWQRRIIREQIGKDR